MKKIERKSKIKKIILVVIWVFIGIFISYGLYNPLSVSQFTMSSQKISKPIRIALISDLHSCRYGDGQIQLLTELDNYNPDLICLVGDIFDDRLNNNNAEIFISKISGKYPCYYVSGNHEYRMDTMEFEKEMDFLEQCGIIRLSNESKRISINNQNIIIAGIDDPQGKTYDDISNVLKRIKTDISEEEYSILLSHRPEYYQTYVEYGFDLILSGHGHGGQWRIPLLMEKGLLAPNQGLFPRYTNGKYVSDNSTMIVSRGLAKESTIVPRFYNRPEIVIIEVQ